MSTLTFVLLYKSLFCKCVVCTWSFRSFSFKALCSYGLQLFWFICLLLIVIMNYSSISVLFAHIFSARPLRIWWRLSESRVSARLWWHLRCGRVLSIWSSPVVWGAWSTTLWWWAGRTAGDRVRTLVPGRLLSVRVSLKYCTYNMIFKRPNEHLQYSTHIKWLSTPNNLLLCNVTGIVCSCHN